MDEEIVVEGKLKRKHKIIIIVWLLTILIGGICALIINN